MKNKNVEKCCADCKHHLSRYYTMGKKNFYCKLSGRKDRVTGEMNYESCYFCIDTKKCQFEKSYFYHVFGFNLCCFHSCYKHNLFF